MIRMRTALRLQLFCILGVLALATAGCACRSVIVPGPLEQGHYISGVPFFRQDENTCGPAALASVVSYWGGTSEPDEIAARVYLRRLRGTLPMDMERFMQDAGFKTFAQAGSFEALKTMILRDLPVIALLDAGFGLYRRPHYVTVIGFDETRQEVIMHDGITPNRLIGYRHFLKDWNRAGLWMLIAAPASGRESGL